MTVKAQVVAQSQKNRGKVITTLQLKYPRFIHSEFLTHRVFSRNSSSSRAIPIEKMIELVDQDPAEPLVWGSNKPGMQAGEELTGWRLLAAKVVWHLAAKVACTLSLLLFRIGLHKQHANRLTEPFQHIHTVVTSTEWDNFMELRNHKDAQPEIKQLAQSMLTALSRSVPTQLKDSDIPWHLPYVTPQDINEYGNNLELLKKISAARCARVSYLNHQGKRSTVEQDIKLFNQLAESRPLHLSPLEHQATPSRKGNANFSGWKQFRKELEDSHQMELDLNE